VPLKRNQRLLTTSPFNRIVCTALASGLLAGLVLTGLQSLRVAPLILQAETYEEAQATTKAGGAAAPHRHNEGARELAVAEVDHDAHAALAGSAVPAAHAHSGEPGVEPEHDHEHSGWKPENGAERTFFSAVANISMAVAFGLLLSAAMTLRGVSLGWRDALLWGAAGYAVFFLAPSLGLPPEVPGTAAAPLGERQVWWLLTVAGTAGALALLALAPRWPLKLAGVAILMAPHLVGAPQPLVHASAAPADLAQSFIYATAFTNAVFWLVLGALSGFFFKKFN
jgi:cobalt transporter subunit CbtA